jgi:hypothetical protein
MPHIRRRQLTPNMQWTQNFIAFKSMILSYLWLVLCRIRLHSLLLRTTCMCIDVHACIYSYEIQLVLMLNMSDSFELMFVQILFMVKCIEIFKCTSNDLPCG